MARDLHDLARSLLIAANDLPGAAREGVEAAALLVTTQARKNIRDAVGSDMRMSHVGARGAKVGARYDIRGSTNPTALVSAQGPLQLIERDTRPHQEVARSAHRGRRHRRAQVQSFAGAKPLSTPYGPRYRVNHPGTKGKHPFERAVNTTQALIPGVFSRQVDEHFRRAFLR